MFKVFSGISYITTLFALIFSLISNYGDKTNIYAWIAFASQLFNAILFTTLDMLKTKVEQQREDIKWLDGELSKVKSQLADIKKILNKKETDFVRFFYFLILRIARI